MGRRPPVTPEQQEGIEKYRKLMADDFEWFAREWLTIVDRDDPTGSGVKKLVFNPCQKALHNTIERVKRFNLKRSEMLNAIDPMEPISAKPVKMVLLKARKMGVSTYIEARGFHLCEFNQSTEMLVMSHKKDSAKNIARMMSTFHHKFPKRGNNDVGDPQPHFRQTITRPNGDEIHWNPTWGSKATVMTAGSKGGASRSFTYHYLHISEAAHYSDGSELSNALAAGAGFPEIYEESTANGEGNLFHDSWEKAMYIEEAEQLLARGEPMPKEWNGKFRFFWGWYQDPAYRKGLLPEEAEAIAESLDDEEKKLVDEFDVTLEQLAWRRAKIKGECSQQSEMEPLEHFHQEYPTTPEEAFVSKGNTVFDQKRLATFMAAAKQTEPKRFGRYIKRDVEMWEVVPTHLTNANYLEWEGPREDEAYILGVDSAEGLEHSDKSVISVFHRTSINMAVQVAQYRNVLEAEDHGELAVIIARRYNDAFIIPERSGGAGSVTCLKIFNMGYTSVVQTENIERIKNKLPAKAFYVGFQTTPVSRWAIIEAARGILKNDEVILRSAWSIKEWKIFQNLNGKPQAPRGRHDDCVLADMLALHGHFNPQSGAPPIVAHLREMRKMREKREMAKVDTPGARHARAFKKQRSRWNKEAKKKALRDGVAKLRQDRGGIWD